MTVAAAEQEHVVIIGTGYAGMLAARSLSRRLRSRHRITVINDHSHFVERVRLHQAAIGQELAGVSLPNALPRADVIIDRVTAIHPESSTVELAGGRQIAYTRLVYALGSLGSEAPYGTGSVSTTDRSVEFAMRLDTLHDGTVAVVGGGLTGIEAATEIAEARPDLSVTLITTGEPAVGLSAAAHRHLERTLTKLGVVVRTRTTVSGWDGSTLDGFDAAGVAVRITADLVVWTAGFTVQPIAAEAGLATDDHGRVLVDEWLRSITDPRIRVIGDAAAARAIGGGVGRMCCQAAVPMAWRAAADLAAEIQGGRRRRHRTRFVWQNISLGRHDGITQFSHADDSPLPVVLTGRASALFKEAISYGVAWLVTGRRHPLPRRDPKGAVSACRPDPRQ